MEALIGRDPDPKTLRFVAGRAQDGTPAVFDRRHSRQRVVVDCLVDDQAERIADFLNCEFPPPRGP